MDQRVWTSVLPVWRVFGERPYICNTKLPKNKKAKNNLGVSFVVLHAIIIWKCFVLVQIGAIQLYLAFVKRREGGTDEFLTESPQADFLLW